MVPRTLAALAVLAVLAGCSGDPEPKIADPKPSVTSSPAAPSPSVSAAAETPEAFIERWAQAEVDMQNTGVTTDYRSITSSCKSCAQLATQVEAYYAAGGYVRFGGQSVKSVEELGRTGDRIVVRVGLVAQPTKFKKSAASKVETFSGGPTTYKMTLVQTQGTLTLLEYSRLAS